MQVISEALDGLPNESEHLVDYERMILGPDSPAAQKFWQTRRQGFRGISDLLPRAATWLTQQRGRTFRTVLLCRVILEASDEYARLSELDMSRASLRDKAWITRNILELLLTYLLVRRSDVHLLNFVECKSRDHIDILESLSSLSEDDDDVEWARNEVGEVESSAAAGHLTIPKRPKRTSEVAKIVDWSEEYQAVYKLYSKYVHPTSWRICSGGGANRFVDNLVRMTLIGRATDYARELLTLIAEDAELSESDRPAGPYDTPLPSAQPDTFAAPFYDKELARLIEKLELDDMFG